MEKSASYSHDIPNDSEFAHTRDLWRTEMGNSKELRNQAIDLTISSNKFQYGYQWDWCGVPIIRHPDDIVLQQEIIWKLKPTHVIETGVARGGSLTLSSSLIEISVNRDKVDMFTQNESRLYTDCIDPRLIGDKPDAFAPQKIKIIMLKDIDSQLDGLGMTDGT